MRNFSAANTVSAVKTAESAEKPSLQSGLSYLSERKGREALSALSALSGPEFTAPTESKDVMSAAVEFLTAAQSADPATKAAGHMGMGRLLGSLKEPVEGMPLDLPQMKQQAVGHLISATNTLPAQITALLEDFKAKGAAADGDAEMPEELVKQNAQLNHDIATTKGRAGFEIAKLMGNATPRVFLDNAANSPDMALQASAYQNIGNRQYENVPGFEGGLGGAVGSYIKAASLTSRPEQREQVIGYINDAYKAAGPEVKKDIESQMETAGRSDELKKDEG